MVPSDIRPAGRKQGAVTIDRDGPEKGGRGIQKGLGKGGAQERLDTATMSKNQADGWH